MNKPMRLIYSVLQTRAALLVSLVAFGLIASAATPRPIWSQGARIPVPQSPAQTIVTDSVIEACQDAKSLIGLLWLKAYEGPGS